MFNVGGTHFNNEKIDPIGDRPDEQNEGEKRRRRVHFQGRTWGEEEKETIELDPQWLTSNPMRKEETEFVGMYSDKVGLAKAQKMFDQLTTLEEKIAQLCFFELEALYDTKMKREVELLIQAWQIGGLLYTGGVYDRQLFLTDHFQRLSKTPLLVGNGLLHSLSYYYEDLDPPSLHNALSEQRCSDMGKTIMGINRRLKVHFQFDHEKDAKSFQMNEDHLKAFRKGVRQTHGIIAQSRRAEAHCSLISKENLFLFGNEEKILPKKQEFVGVKSLNFIDLTDSEISEELLINAIKNHYEIFLCNQNIQQVVTTIAAAIRNGKLWEKHLDRLVMKLLVLKAMVIKD